MCVDLRSWGRPHALTKALGSSNRRLRLGNREKAIPLCFLGGWWGGVGGRGGGGGIVHPNGTDQNSNY